MENKNDILEIIIYGSEVLKQKAEPVEELTDKDRRLIEQMAETMYKFNGIGLAANQVDVLKQIVILDIDQMDVKYGGSGKPLLQVFINPVILHESEEDIPFEEGCLSIPGIEANVYRPFKVNIEYYDLDFEKHTKECDGLLARVIQHEIDHLNGVLFVDRLGFAKRASLAGKLNRLKKEGAHRTVPDKSPKL